MHHSATNSESESGDYVVAFAYVAAFAVFYAWLGLGLAAPTARTLLDLGALLVLVGVLSWGWRKDVSHSRPKSARSIKDHLRRWLSFHPHRTALNTAVLPTAVLVVGDSILRHWQPSRLAIGLYATCLALFSVWWSPQLGGRDPVRMKAATRRLYLLSASGLWVASLVACTWLASQIDDLSRGTR
jgi:hypothetical protein